MSTSALISEINSLTDEIKRRSAALRELRKRKRNLESQVIEFLENNNQRGVTYKGEISHNKRTKVKIN